MTEPQPDAIRPMPCHPARMAQALADTVEAVIGVDTHADTHTLALVDVKVLDHFVVGGDAVMSFAECGRL